MADSDDKEKEFALSTSDHFIDFAAPWGGVATCSYHEFETAHTYSIHKLLLEISKKILRDERINVRGKILTCDFGFIENDVSDAFAEHDAGRHAFGVHSGLVMLSYYLSGELFIVRDHRDQFRLTHPHPNLEVDSAMFSLAPDAGLEYDLALHSARTSHLVDKRRVAIGQYFREFFLLFAFFHEFHHVIWGHCEFTNSSIGAARLHEVGPTETKVKNDLLLHNIEYLADIGAIDLMVWYVNKRSRLNFKWLSRISFADLHRLALVACGVMCATWNAHDHKKGRDGTHPEPGARFGNLLAHYANVMSHFKGEEFFKHKIAKLAIMDLTFLSDSCPEIAIVIGDMQALVSDEKHVSMMQEIFTVYRKETLAYEFRTRKEIDKFGWS
ncbi:MAG TPA: hypothetical protein VL996_13720 [Methylocella sp.]|nr:hypothetical protein [Methylocella sp.]